MANTAQIEALPRRIRYLDYIKMDRTSSQEAQPSSISANDEHRLGIGLDHTRSLRIARQLKRKK